jgi:hypothetical protein
MAESDEQYDDLEFLPTKDFPDRFLENFTGRSDILKTVDISLRNLQRNLHLGLRFDGERGAGKTSLLTHIEKKLCPEMDILAVNINVFEFKQALDVMLHVCQAIRAKAI